MLLAAIAFVPLGLVTVKMLPFDNKSEFQVMVDMPEGTALETTARVSSALASAALEDEAVVDVQQYVGTSAPYNFNGLVRHYFLRQAPHLADLQVNLVAKGDRSAQSHDVARRVRDRLLPIARSFGATLQVAEVPPGPPVLQTLWPKSTAPIRSVGWKWPHRSRTSSSGRRASSIRTGTSRRRIRRSRSWWTVKRPRPQGYRRPLVASLVRMAGSGEVGGLLHDAQAREDVPIVMRLPRARRAASRPCSRLRLVGTRPVAVGEVTRAVRLAGGHQPLPQEPAAGDLRDRRSRRAE